MSYSSILLASCIIATWGSVQTQSTSLSLDASPGHNIRQRPAVDALFLNPTLTLQAAAVGVIETVAGSGTAGYSGDGGQAKLASLRGPVGIFVDSEGTIFFSDRNNDVVRKIETSGIISTIAGNGNIGYSGDGGKATDATMKNPFQVYKDSNGRIFIAEAGNNVIRMIDTNGVISTHAGTGSQSSFSADGTQATNAVIYAPSAVSVDQDGRILVNDGELLRKIGATGSLSTIAGTSQVI